MKVRLVLTAAFLTATCLAVDAAAQATGTVVDADGRPIAGVVVNAQLQEVVKTAADGTFRLKAPTPLVRLFKEGYRPTTRLLDASDTRIVLEIATTPPVVVPECAGADTHRVDVGLLRLPTPKGTTALPGSDIDYVVMRWKYRGAWLLHGTGPMWSYGYPGADDLRGLRDVIERDVRLPVARPPDADALGDDQLVLDIRGTRSNGRRFRFVGVLMETLRYDDASPDEAAFFDRMLDAMCYAASPPLR